ncbi:hypothetical protein QMZ05_12505 [Bradyrhizobium sp. INPA03-11B]|uniref:hypothetical protein n=1 Tax=Bradyrhizobium sp. INPA03-11B TaxID=418598 RepID=UPI00338E90B3
MAVRTRITSYERNFQLILDRNLSAAVRSKRVADFAQAQIDDADAINAAALGGSAPPKTVTVDGKQGAPLDSVNPDRGIIIAEWRLVGEVLLWIYSTLVARSPVVSGEYQRGHTLYADGTKSNPARPPLAGEYIFINVVPYARKIEIGKTESGRDFVIQVQNRIYERTAEDAVRQFGNIAKIRFTYKSASGAARRQDDRVPAIVVTLK